MSKEVSGQTLLKIVEEIRKRPCLWNPAHEHNNNRSKVAVAWDEIASLMNVPDTILKAKWKNMRSILRREMNRCSINSKGELKYLGKWRYFKVMSFLHKPKDLDLITYDPTEESDRSSEQNVKEEILKIEKEIDMSEDNTAAFEENSIFAMDFQPEHDSLPVKRRQSEEDCDLMFLKSLLPYCRDLDPVRKLRLRSKLLDVVIDEISSSSHETSTR